MNRRRKGMLYISGSLKSDSRMKVEYCFLINDSSGLLVLVANSVIPKDSSASD